MKNSLWLFGKHPVFCAIKSKRREVLQILATRNSMEELSQFLKKNSLPKLQNKIRIVDERQIEMTIGKGQTHQGLAMNCSMLQMKNEQDFFDSLQDSVPKNVVLILDQLTDPHNVGAIIRSAAAFGVKKIVFPENNCAKESAVMVKSSAGTIDNVDLFEVVNLSKFMARLKEFDFWCFGLDGEARDDISQMRNYDKIALIVGSEGKGIRPLVKKNCDLLVKIGMEENVESLNASVACAVALYELAR